MEEELMLKVENVSKIYKLGEIGGTTLRESLQRVWAKLRHKDDPTRKIGTKNYNKGEKFKALDDISFEVKKGERLGIIGHNGAGKSTLLKLISRVTSPSKGKIMLNGRVASMLEVGTGFHPELTGRENIYMNGAILGMTKREIDAKIEKIIDFSEVRQFIDTPVKRYSSGMYVKLAFSVSAHLDSEIVIMDEVLAVGDMAFQKKCVNKMRDISEKENKTILYVSHNMSTIRQLCNRVVVLSEGKIVFDGDVEEGIARYLNLKSSDETFFDLRGFKRNSDYCTGLVKMTSSELLSTKNTFNFGSSISLKLSYICSKELENLLFRFTIFKLNGVPLETSFYQCSNVDVGEHNDKFIIDTSNLVPDRYYLRIVILEITSESLRYNHDYVDNGAFFTIVSNDGTNNILSTWPKELCGNIYHKDIKKS